MWPRMFTSSMRAPANSFFDVNQFDFQVWMTPTRRPPGWTLCPIFGWLLLVGVCFGLGLRSLGLGLLRRSFGLGFGLRLRLGGGLGLGLGDGLGLLGRGLRLGRRRGLGGGLPGARLAPGL